MLFTIVACSNSTPVTDSNTLDFDDSTVFRESVRVDHNTLDMASEFNSPSRDQWQKPDSILSLFGELEDKTVVDLGAGTGYFAFKLAERGANVIATDVVKSYLNFIDASKKSHADMSGTIETREVPYDDPKIAEGEADAILIVNTFYQIEDRVAFFKKVKKGLQAKGQMLLVESKENTCVDEAPSAEERVGSEQMEEELTEAGFKVNYIKKDLLECQYVMMVEPQ